MTEVTDIDLVFLNSQISGDTLVLTHNGVALEGELRVWLVEKTSTTIALTDFEHDDMRIRVHGFTIGNDGALVPWDRTTEGVTSPPIVAGEDRFTLDYTITAVAYEPTNPSGQEDLDSFVPVTRLASVRVDVPPKGSKPD